MAYLHHASLDALRSELDLWTLPPTQTVIEGSQWVPYKPVTSIDQSNTIEFCIPGTGSEYIDPAHTLIITDLKIVNGNGTDLKADDKSDAALINYASNTIYGQNVITLNGVPVGQAAMGHAVRSIEGVALAYGLGAKTSYLAMGGWAKDTAGAMDVNTAKGGNRGLDERRAKTLNSRTYQVMAPLHADFFNQDKFLLNNVELRVKLTRNRDAFVLMSSTADKFHEKLVILDATLLVRKVRLSPSVLLAHAAALEKAPAKYPFTRTDVKTYTIPSGLHDKSIPNLHMGQVPKRIVIGFVSNEAFNGSYKLNPFNFQHFNLNYLTLHVDSEQIPVQPLTPDFKNGNYVEAYNTLFAGTGVHWKDEGNDISYADYGNGYTLYVFDLTPDLSAHEAHWNLQKQGVVRLEVRFAEALPTAVNCIVYSEFNNLIEIDKNRNVVVDFAN